MISIHVIKVNSARHTSFELVNPTKVIKKWQRGDILNMHLALQNKWIVKKLFEISWAWVGIYCFLLGQKIVREVKLMVKIFPCVKHNHLFLSRLVLKYPSAFRYCIFLIMLISVYFRKPVIWIMMYLVQRIKEKTGTRKVAQERKSMFMPFPT